MFLFLEVSKKNICVCSAEYSKVIHNCIGSEEIESIDPSIGVIIIIFIALDKKFEWRRFSICFALQEEEVRQEEREKNCSITID